MNQYFVVIQGNLPRITYILTKKHYLCNKAVSLFKTLITEIPLISATADAFRGHGFNLLITTFLRGFQLMLFPQKSPPPLQSTRVHLAIYKILKINTENAHKKRALKCISKLISINYHSGYLIYLCSSCTSANKSSKS